MTAPHRLRHRSTAHDSSSADHVVDTDVLTAAGRFDSTPSRTCPPTSAAIHRSYFAAPSALHPASTESGPALTGIRGGDCLPPPHTEWGHRAPLRRTEVCIAIRGARVLRCNKSKGNHTRVK
ncbi:unspecified product [Leishmania tarentolae]|uniref:Unspecified product n=1 Tax=Leishmania tarentolae TaxID=5689 RepID=A0A640KAK9_LEITA|nr:unspecified product [Leishmania tarentolae]